MFAFILIVLLHENLLNTDQNNLNLIWYVFPSCYTLLPFIKTLIEPY